MKKLFLILVLGIWMTSYAQFDKDQLSLDISKADAANTEQLKAFIWKKESTVTVNGKVKLNSLSEFSFDEKGELQMKNIDVESPVKQKFGIRGRIQQREAESSMDYVSKALELALLYTYMDKGQLLNFISKAEVVEKDGVIQISASDVYVKGDSLTIKVDLDTKLFLHKKFSSIMDEDPITGEIVYGKFSSGISHATKSMLDLPGKNAVINSENKDYSRRVK